jgi:hypothetical protein
MLANGVERVIEQVINPKILQLIKPKIDDVVCSHLGIDPKERQAKIEATKQQQKQSLQSLMSIKLSQAGMILFSHSVFKVCYILYYGLYVV